MIFNGSVEEAGIPVNVLRADTLDCGDFLKIDRSDTAYERDRDNEGLRKRNCPPDRKHHPRRHEGARRRHQGPLSLLPSRMQGLAILLSMQEWP